jgi:hypothetical protein
MAGILTRDSALLIPTWLGPSATVNIRYSRSRTSTAIRSPVVPGGKNAT